MSDRETAALNGFLAVYEGPWGLKASEEDALLGILHAVDPDIFPKQDADAIYRIRTSAWLSAAADALTAIMQEGNDAHAIIAAFLPVLDLYRKAESLGLACTIDQELLIADLVEAISELAPYEQADAVQRANEQLAN